MRTTSPHPAADPIRKGDPALSEVLHQALAYAGQVDRYAHGFHTYPAGLHPDAARDLVATFPGDSVYDPFCGGGTVLVEALAAQRAAIGRDVSPIALRVSRARTATPSDEVLTKMRSAARKLTAAARAATEPPVQDLYDVVETWYAPHVLAELWSLKQGIAAVPDKVVRDLLAAAFSSILVKTSWRRSDTSPQRVPHDRPPGTASILFHKRIRLLGRQLAALREAAPQADLHIRFGDARDPAPREVDLVLTSPPYPSTYDYVLMQQLRMAWLGDIPRQDAEIGSRKSWRQLGKRKARAAWDSDTQRWTRQAAKALRPGGHMVVVIGDGLTPNGVVDTSKISEASAQQAGLESVARASVARPDHARQTLRWEHAFAFRRPEG